MKVLRTAPLAILLAASGCSRSTPSTEPDAGGIAVDDYCPTQAEVLCDGWQRCCDLEDYDGCVEWMLHECESGEISSVRAGESTLDGVVAERCLEAYSRSFDDCTRNEDISAACRYRWYGDGAPGEPCRDVWHCQRGLGCVLSGTDGTCIEVPGASESCEATGVCQGGSYCSYADWICHPEPGLGEPCEREETCAAGACVEGTCQAVPWCE